MNDFIKNQFALVAVIVKKHVFFITARVHEKQIIASNLMIIGLYVKWVTHEGRILQACNIIATPQIRKVNTAKPQEKWTKHQ